MDRCGLQFKGEGSAVKYFNDRPNQFVSYAHLLRVIRLVKVVQMSLTVRLRVVIFHFNVMELVGVRADGVFQVNQNLGVRFHVERYWLGEP